MSAANVIDKDAWELSMLQRHFSEMHGPLGHHPSVTGGAWTDLAALKKAHESLHRNFTWAHSHKEMA